MLLAWSKKTSVSLFYNRIAGLLLSLIFSYNAFGQTVVGMGTDKPNANAVLELYAKDHSQGFLVPRLTTAQRTAAAFTSRLGQADHGLLVFDTDQGAFYFWFEGKWEQSIGEDSNILKKANWYTGNTAPNMPAENGDFYINNTTGDLYRHQNGTFEIIGTIKEKSYQAGAGINVSTDGTITNTGDLNSTNEIQDLQLNNNTIKITNNPAASAIDLTPYLDNTDQQTLSFDPATQKLSLSNGGSVNLNSINTDSQDLNLNGNTLSLTNDITSVNLSATSPTDGQVLKWNAAQNHWEAQSDAIGTTYTAGTGISINGSNQIINTAPNQAVSLTGTGAATVSGTYPNFTINATDNVDDADNDPANEIQDLQLTGNTLKVTNNLGATDINLAGYLDNTDGQTLSFNTTTQELSLSNGGMVNLGSINTDAQNLSLSGNTLSLTNDATNVSLSATTPANGEVLKWNAAQNRWEAHSDN